MTPTEIISWGVGLGVPLVSVITALGALWKSGRNGHRINTHDGELSQMRKEIMELRKLLDVCTKERIRLEGIIGRMIE